MNKTKKLIAFVGGIVLFYFFFSSITIVHRMTTPILNNISAPLKIGKLIQGISIKSLTPWYIILSIRLPTVPPSNIVVSRRLRCFCLHSRINNAIPAILTPITILYGMGNDHEIPVLKLGVIHILVSPIFCV